MRGKIWGRPILLIAKIGRPMLRRDMYGNRERRTDCMRATFLLQETRARMLPSLCPKNNTASIFMRVKLLHLLTKYIYLFSTTLRTLHYKC